jgi:hypothetical protein
MNCHSATVVIVVQVKRIFILLMLTLSSVESQSSNKSMISLSDNLLRKHELVGLVLVNSKGPYITSYWLWEV